MSFKTNLGRVRGEKGVSYVPRISPQTENGVVKRVKPGSTTLKITYKVSSSTTFAVNYTINFVEHYLGRIRFLPRD